MSRYRGRRRGVSPLMLLIALVVAIAAVVLTVMSIPLAIRFYGRRSR